MDTPFPTNKDQLIGNWKQLKGEAQHRWGKLTESQLDVVEGSRTKLSGQVQEAYGIAKEEAEKQIDEWEEAMKKRHAA